MKLRSLKIFFFVSFKNEYIVCYKLEFLLDGSERWFSLDHMARDALVRHRVLEIALPRNQEVQANGI